MKIVYPERPFRNLRLCFWAHATQVLRWVSWGSYMWATTRLARVMLEGFESASSGDPTKVILIRKGRGK